jgi:hypothetical protein
MKKLEKIRKSESDVTQLTHVIDSTFDRVLTKRNTKDAKGIALSFLTMERRHRRNSQLTQPPISFVDGLA